MAKLPTLPYQKEKIAPLTPKEEAVRNIIESYRRKIKRLYPTAVFDTEFVLGTDVPTFVEQLESTFQPEMGWSNYGKWKVSSISKPRALDLSSADGFYKFFHYTNFRAEWARPRGFTQDPTKISALDRYADEV